MAGLCASTPGSIACADEMENPEKVDIDLFASTPESRLLQIDDGCNRVFTVTSLGKSSYIRISATLGSPDFECDFTFDNPRSSNWVCANDGWWYMTLPIGRGQSGNVATSFHVRPSNGLIEALSHSGKVRIDEHIIAQAIDAADLDLDFSADEPWGEDAFLDADNKDRAAEEIIKTSISGNVAEYDKGHDKGSFNKTGDNNVYMVSSLAGIAIIALLSAYVLRRFLVKRRNAQGLDTDKTDTEEIGA